MGDTDRIYRHGALARAWVRVISAATVVMGCWCGLGCASVPPAKHYARTPADTVVIERANVLHAAVKPAAVSDADARRYVQRLGARIVGAARRMGDGRITWTESYQTEFALVRSPLTNVFTAGGSHVYLYAGMFELCQCEEDVVAVLAHSYAHVSLRYAQSLSLPTAAQGARAIALGFAARPDGDDADQIAADEQAAAMFVFAGYEPAKFADFMRGKVSQGRFEAMQRALDQASQKRPRRHAPLWDEKRLGEARERVAEEMDAHRNASDEADELLNALPACFPRAAPAADQELRQRARRELQPAPRQTLDETNHIG